MASHVIAVMAVQSRQSYITSNNRLLQSVGASKLLDQVMDWWHEHTDRDRVLYVGGGNAAVHFDSVGAARRAIGEWSRYWTRNAPGARLVAGIGEDSESQWAAWDKARQSLADDEEEGAFGLEPGILPVTRYCPDTGLAANEFHEFSKSWKSAEAIRKEECARRYDRELHSGPMTMDAIRIAREQTSAKIGFYRNELLGQNYRFPLDLDNLGLRRAERHIAVVHCDGNGIGALWRELDRSRELAASLAELSSQLARISQTALQAALSHMRESLKAWQERGVLDTRTSPDGRQFLPIRPLIDSGDDVTWICAGQLGLGSAAAFCRAFEEKAREVLGREGVSACAGVAIVPVGFPFRRAHGLATELCGEAKKKRQERGDGSGYLHYQVVTEGADGSAEKARSSYRRGLVRRPFRLPDEWLDCESRWRYFKECWEPSGRGRAKKLFETLATGRAEDLVRLFEQQGYALPRGVNAEECFEALEILDFHTEWETGRGGGEKC